MRAAPKFNLSVQVGDVADTHLWDSQKPLPLGHFLPWSIERPSGEVRLIHKSGSIFPLAPEILKDGTEIELREPDNTSGLSVSLKIRELTALEPVFADPGGDTAPFEWIVFAMSGEWVLDEDPVGTRYRGRRDTKTAFVIQKAGNGFRIKIKDKAIKLDSLETIFVPRVDERGIYDIGENDLGKVELGSETIRWRFKRISTGKARSLTLLPPPLDEETIWFRRGLGMLTAAVFLLLLISVFIIAPKEEEKVEELQFARIVLPKRTKTAALEAQDAGGAAAIQPAQQAEQQAPAESEQKQQAKAEPAPKSAPAKAPTQRTDNGKVAEAPAAPVRPVAPVKPVVSKAVLQARAFESSMQKMLGAVPTELLRKADSASRSKSGTKGGAVFQGSSAASQSGSLSTAGIGSMGSQNVKVAYVGQGGSPNAKGGAVGYGSGVPSGVGVKGGKGNFISVAATESDVRIGSEEGLTRKEVWEVINRHMSEVRYCYERAGIRRPDIEGKLQVQFLIGGQGIVKSSAVKASTVSDSGLDNCVVERLASWKFPKPRGNIDVNVLYPFTFKRL